ncbi:MAG: sigma 54-interacting transcriptional regulator [Opitutaceae bacterium]|nr:sigma 54-interacting transcriptional regulator [Opitutaceae bacterium]
MNKRHHPMALAVLNCRQRHETDQPQAILRAHPMNDCASCAARAASENEPKSQSMASFSTSCRFISELGILHEVSAYLSRGYQIGDALGILFDRLKAVRGLDHGLLTILNRETSRLLADTRAVGPGCQGSPEVGGLDHGVIASAIRERTPQILSPVNGIGEDKLTPWEQAWLKDCPLPSGILIIVPIQHGNENIGALSFVLPESERAAVEADVQLLTLVAGQVGLAVKFRQIAQERLDTLKQENERLHQQIKRSLVPEGMIGKSSAMRMVYFHVDQVADSKTTVLIRGETGVGKERIAQAIWQGGSRKAKPFVRVNCAALPESIIESELFGHEKGAFTGALALRKGRFELAHTGTLFLDEIGEISLATQAKLLRVLQEGTFERVGGVQPIKVDVRVITATNRNLEEMIEQGIFRLDLYYRINVFPIYIPPLRERRSDLLELSDYFLEKYSLETGKKVTRISTPAIDMLMAYHWPGNVRELENIIERAVLLTQDGVIHGFHLPPTLQTPESPESASRTPTLEEALAAVEKEMIVDALKANRGIMAKAARQLGLTERTMGLRVKLYEIDPKRFRVAESPP